jgi:hypothetical protein
METNVLFPKTDNWVNSLLFLETAESLHAHTQVLLSWISQMILARIPFPKPAHQRGYRTLPRFARSPREEREKHYRYVSHENQYFHKLFA